MIEADRQILKSLSYLCASHDDILVYRLTALHSSGRERNTIFLKEYIRVYTTQVHYTYHVFLTWTHRLIESLRLTPWVTKVTFYVWSTLRKRRSLEQL